MASPTVFRRRDTKLRFPFERGDAGSPLRSRGYGPGAPPRKPISGILSDRFGSRPFATSGMLGTAFSFVLLDLLPVNFSYWPFAGALLLMGLSMGAFAAPNCAGVMNSLPAGDRGAGGAMNQTFQNAAQVLSIGIFS